MVVAVSRPGWAPVIVAVALLWSWRARRLRGIAIVILALLPLLISTIVINALLPAGGSRLAGTRAALVVLGLSLPPSLLLLTTRLADLLDDLELRGLPAGAAFVVASAVAAAPRLRQRALRVADARRARGLDHGGSWSGRLLGLRDLTAPVVYGALAEVEDRTLALEARGFGAARRRTILRPAPDSAWQRALRWLLVGAALIITATAVLQR